MQHRCRLSAVRIRPPLLAAMRTIHINIVDNAARGDILWHNEKKLYYRFNIEVQHCCAKIVRIFVLVSRSSKVFWVGG